MNIRSLLEAGHAALQADHDAKETANAGHPRIGSIGAVVDDKVYGVCHRIALARSLGIEKAIPLSQDIMFKAGEANEDTWARILGAPKSSLKIRRHSEVAVRERLPGVPLEVLGHPDIVLDQDGVTMGLELKGIFGYSTAASVYFQGVPKNDNLIQAAGYSWFKQIPYALCYTCANWTSVSHWDQKKYGIKHILPFYRIFYMEWRDRVLWYRDELETEWVETVITPESIVAYYQLIAEMAAKKELGPRPTADYVNGAPSKWGTQGSCNLCDFKSACDRYDMNKNFDGWIDDIKFIAEETAE